MEGVDGNRGIGRARAVRPSTSRSGWGGWAHRSVSWARSPPTSSATCWSGICARNKVDTSLVVRGPENTTLGFVSLPEDGSEPQYAFVATGAADRTVTRPTSPTTCPKPSTALQFGSISLVQEPGASAYEALMRREAGRRVLVLDPNIRPGLIADRDAYVARMEGWIEMMDLVRASVVDIEWLYPGETIDAVAERWRSLGAGVVIVTLGGGGRARLDRSRRRPRRGPPVAVEDTVGAGDSFFSGALSRLHGLGHLTRDGLAAIDAGTLEAAWRSAAGAPRSPAAGPAPTRPGPKRSHERCAASAGRRPGGPGGGAGPVRPDAGPANDPDFTPLAGGVSSDIWRVDLARGRSASNARWPS